MLPPKEARIQGVAKHDGVEVEGLSSAVEQESRDLPENAPSLMVIVGPCSAVHSTRLGLRVARSTMIWQPKELPTSTALFRPTVPIQAAKASESLDTFRTRGGGALAKAGQVGRVDPVAGYQLPKGRDHVAAGAD